MIVEKKEPLSVWVGLRLTESEKAALISMAAEQHRSVSAMLRVLLLNQIKNRGNA